MIPVLIQGETGTGKEVVARQIHERGPRAGKPMLCVNCAAIPDQLTESTLFGHEKGAFTGADRRQRGAFERADGGTLLLDEVGELSAGAQASLLRVLETGHISRVGGGEEIPVDVRVLAATHRDLEAMCRAGGFRQDLLFRINTMTLKIPPLRQRGEEIEPLALAFLQQANEANGCQVSGISPEALELLRRHSWPGNVRELRNVIHRAVVIALGPQITPEDLPEELAGAGGPAAAPLPIQEQEAGDLDFKTRVQQFEIGLIRQALASTSGNQTEAAKLLRIPLRTLAHKVKTFGIPLAS
jgi:DNA-binding NtrC family response regulator